MGADGTLKDDIIYLLDGFLDKVDVLGSQYYCTLCALAYVLFRLEKINNIQSVKWSSGLIKQFHITRVRYHLGDNFQQRKQLIIKLDDIEFSCSNNLFLYSYYDLWSNKQLNKDNDNW